MQQGNNYKRGDKFTVKGAKKNNENNTILEVINTGPSGEIISISKKKDLVIIRKLLYQWEIITIFTLFLF